MSTSIYHIQGKGYHCYPLPLVQCGKRFSVPEWRAQVTQLPVGRDRKILEKRESERAKGKGDQKEKKKKGSRKRCFSSTFKLMRLFVKRLLK